MNRHCLATMANPIGDCSPRSSSVLFRTPPVTHDACEMGWSPFACFYTSAPIAEVFVQIGLPRSETAFPKTEGLFTVGIECRKGSLPVTLDRTSPLRNRITALQ